MYDFISSGDISQVHPLYQEYSEKYQKAFLDVPKITHERYISDHFRNNMMQKYKVFVLLPNDEIPSCLVQVLGPYDAVGKVFEEINKLLKTFVTEEFPFPPEIYKMILNNPRFNELTGKYRDVEMNLGKNLLTIKGFPENLENAYSEFYLIAKNCVDSRKCVHVQFDKIDEIEVKSLVDDISKENKSLDVIISDDKVTISGWIQDVDMAEHKIKKLMVNLKKNHDRKMIFLDLHLFKIFIMHHFENVKNRHPDVRITVETQGEIVIYGVKNKVCECKQYIENMIHELQNAYKILFAGEF